MHRTRLPLNVMVLASACLTALTLALGELRGQPEIQVGLVTAIHGHWQIQTPGGKRLLIAGGESLPTGSVLSTVERSADICISRFDRKENEWYRVPGNYRGPVTLRADRPQVSVSARFQVALKRFFAAPRTVYVPGLSRHEQTIALGDEVVPLKPEGIDLAAIFAEAAAGQDSAILQRKVIAAHAGKPHLAWSEVTTSSVHWQPGEPVLFHARGLSEGLYRVVLKSDPSGADAIILASAPAAFEERTKELAEIRRLESWWGAGLDLRERRGCLRSYLDVMSDDLAKR